MRVAPAIAVVVTMLGLADTAHADWILSDDEDIAQAHFDFVAGTSFTFDEFPLGLWLNVPILREGVAPISDSLDVELGALIVVTLDDAYLVAGLGPRYTLYLTEAWHAFATFKGAYVGQGGVSAFRVGASLGTDLYFTESMGLRFEVMSYFTGIHLMTAGLIVGF